MQDQETGDLMSLRTSAVTAFLDGIFERALDIADEMLRVDPRYGFGWKLRGVTLAQQGRIEEALTAFLKAGERMPLDPEVAKNTGIAYRDLGRIEDAIAAFEYAVSIDPSYVDAITAIADVRRNQGLLADAKNWLLRALEIDPGLASARHQLAHLLRAEGDLQGAIGAFEKACAAEPSNALYQSDLAITSNKFGKTLLDRGDLGAAAQAFSRACAIDPSNPEHYNSLGATHNALGNREKAFDCYSRALAINPDHVFALSNLGCLYHNWGRASEARRLLERALKISPDSADTMINLAAVHLDLGEIQQASDYYRAVLEINPNNTIAYSGLFLINSYAPQANSPIVSPENRYDAFLKAKVPSPYESFKCDPSAKRLRVGLVTGDLLEHPVGYFIESMLENLDPESVELFAYITRATTDELTKRVKPFFTRWISLAGLSDQEAAARIHEDAVHVLVDLAGHTRNNRATMFAHRPAPAQVSWLGYWASTKVRTIDFVLVGPSDVPAEEENDFTEKIWRLPATRLCFTPPRDSPGVPEPPLLRRGHPTFGCFNTLAKISDDVIRIWSRVLLAVPEAQLYLKTRVLGDRLVQHGVAERFERFGIARERLRMEGETMRYAYLCSYHDVDIALDPFPFPGGTTTMEGLWMGVPVLTMRGHKLIGRQGESILRSIGLEEWIAQDEDDYVRRATRFIQERATLSRLRSGMRARLQASPLLDGARFAADWTAALRSIWAQRRESVALQETATVT